MKVLVINGPNINMLGIREPEIYGSDTYEDLLNLVNKTAQEIDVIVDTFQSNHEGEIVDKIQEAYQKYDGIIINPAAYTHTSIAILDALKSVRVPTIEVHISDTNSRDEYRKKSYVSEVAVKTIVGEGIRGYEIALREIVNFEKGNNA